MVKVKVVSKEELIQKIEIKGHANSGVIGQDLVCAGVSSITFGTLNALNEMTKESVELIVDKSIIIKVKNILDERCQIILQTMMIQLATIEEQYSNYIQIKQEVSS